MAQVQNPNWPRISDLIDFYDSRGTPIAGCVMWVDVTTRGRGTTGIVRGRNYESDAQRAGELTTTLDNYDSAFDPTNTSSPFYPLVLLRRPMRRTAQYPVNANLLSPDQATAGSYSGAASGTAINSLTDATRSGSGSSLTDTSGFLSVSTGAASGTVTLTTVTDGPNSQCPNVYQVTLSAGETSKSAPKMWLPVVPGQQYTMQLMARCVTSGASISAFPQLTWCGPGGPDTGPVVNGTSVNLDGFAGLLSQNPNFLVDNSGWTPFNSTVVRSTAVVMSGQTASGLLTPNGTSSIAYTESSRSPVMPGRSYTAQAYLYSPVGHTAAMSINWYDSTGNYLTTSNGTVTNIGTATWTQVSTTATAPANAALATAIPIEGSTPPTSALLYFVEAGLFDPTVTSIGWTQLTLSGTAPTTGVFGLKIALLTGSPALPAARTVQSSAWQVEKGAAASAWVLPGQIYSFITAYNERWPQDYGDAGTYGISAVTASDYLAFLNQGSLLDSIGSTIMQYAPSFYYRFDDQQGATSVADAAGVRQSAPVVTTLNAGSVTFGNTIAAATSSLTPVGTDGSVAHFANTNAAITGIDLTCGGIYPAGPGGGTSTTWSRAVTFRCSSIPAVYAEIWAAYGANAPSIVVGHFWDVGINSSSGTLQVRATVDAHFTAASYTSPTSICDGNWHTVLVTANASGTSTIYVDDAPVATASGLGGAVGAFSADFVGAQQNAPNVSYQDGFTGDIAHVAEWPITISPSNGWGLYQALVSGYAGDSASVRWKRYLSFANPNATYRFTSSVTRAVAAATDIDGGSPFAAMDTMAVTENGDHFISGWGIPTFRARSDRYNTAPVAVFGERSDLGEFPYEQPIGFDYDDARIASQVQVTAQPSGNVYTATDLRSPLPYGPATMPRNSYATSPQELRDSATYLLQRYMDPHLRLRAITVHPGANPTLWAVCLGLDIGSRVRVMRRPIGANPITFDGFVEKLSWSFTPGDAKLVLQLSPADTQTYWMLGGPNAPGTTTLKAGSLAGATTLSVYGMPGGTLLNAGFLQGMPIVVGSGGANSETAIITGHPSNVTASVVGGAIQFAASIPVTALANAHSAADTIAIAGAVAGGYGSLAAYSVLGSTTRLAY
jgi:hypothetical protein